MGKYNKSHQPSDSLMTPIAFASSSNIPHPHRICRDAAEERLAGVEQLHRAFRGSIRPCGKGTIGYAPRKKILKKDKESNRLSLRNIAIEYQDVDPVTGDLLDSSTRVLQKSEIPLYYLPCQESQSVALRKRSARGLTSRGKKRIEDSCFLLERKFGASRLGFYTLTISLTDRESVDAFNAKAACILKRFFEKIKRFYERKSEQFSYVGVWELHPIRSAKCGYPVLHFHYVAPCYRKKSQEFVLSSSQIRDIWTSTVSNGVGLQLERDCRIGCEIVRCSPGGYLSKYLYKGEYGYGDEGDGGGGFCLSSWYSLSRNLYRVVLACTTPVGEFVGDNSGGTGLRHFIDSYTAAHGVIKKDINGRETVLGYWFECTRYFHEFLLVLVDATLVLHL